MVTRATRCVLCWALLLIFQESGTFATPFTSSWPRYVPENGTLNCTCEGKCTGSALPTFSWQSGSSTVSQNGSLVKTNVKRQDNGTAYTCSMKCGEQSSSAVYVLQVSYGPTKEHLNITVSGSVIVGANGTLTLTCLATEVNPTPTYIWYEVPCEDVTGNKGNTCSFTPQQGLDEKTVTCKALSADPESSIIAVQNFKLYLKHPPTTPPLIQGYTDGEILANGSVLSCRVTGGKPLVQSVNFSCDDHPDQPDSIAESSVTSTVTINSSQITDDTTECNCTATWLTQPDLYLRSSDVTIQTEYKADVKFFAINDTERTLEVEGNRQETVVFKCNASGNPTPDIWLYNRTDGALNHGNSSVTYPVDGVTIQDMGTYKCLAENVYGTNDTHVQLLVKSIPQGVDTSNSKDNSTVLTKEGLNFTVLMYPDPHAFSYSFLGKNGNQTTHDVSADMFNGTAVRESSFSPVVVCSIKPVLSIMVENLGVYYVIVANNLGPYRYFFEIKETIIIQDSHSNTLWVILVAVLVPAAILAAVAVLAIWYRKRKGRVKRDGSRQINGGACLTMGSPSGKEIVEYTTPYTSGKQQLKPTKRSPISSASRTPRIDSSGYAVANDVISPEALRVRDGRKGEVYDNLHAKIGPLHGTEYDHLFSK